MDDPSWPNSSQDSPYRPDAKKAGDPNGRRPAKRRAGLLSEAEHVARVLQILLERAEFDDHKLVASLVKDIANEQRVQLMRSEGYVEPRTRFGGNGHHPELFTRPIVTLYVDESGTSAPPGKGSSPTFALGGIAIHEAEAIRYLAKADAIKEQFFGRTNFQFHEPHMRKRHQSGGVFYSMGADTIKQAAFDDAIAGLIDSTEFTTFGVGIRKAEHGEQFVKSGLDPYLPFDVYCVALTMLLERFVDSIAHAPVRTLGRVRVESQGARDDAYHQYEYARLLLDGTQWISESTFRAHLEAGMVFSPKLESDPVELADFFARDLYEWVEGGCTTQPKWWHLFSKKAYSRGDGLMGKFGIKVFPDTDIRELIESHRRAYGAIAAQ